MLRSANRKADRKNFVTRTPRFQPRLEALESRVTPSCTWNPSTNTLTGTDYNTAWFRYRSDGGGYDIYCNFNYVATGPTSNLTFNAATGSESWIWWDETNWQGGGDYTLWGGNQLFWNGNLMLTYNNTLPGNNQVHDVSFFLGSGTNTVTAQTTNMWHPVAHVNGAGSTKLVLAHANNNFWDLTYEITQDSVIVAGFGGLVASFNNIDWVKVRSGAGDDNIVIKNTTGTGALTPGFYVLAETGEGNDTLTVDASNYSDPLTFAFTNVNVSMAWQNFYFYHPELENIVLKTGTGADQIIVGHGGTGGAGISNLTVDGGGCCGVNTLILDDSAQVGGETYTVSPTQVSSNTDGLIVTYSHIIYWNVKGGAGNDFFHVGTNALMGMGPGYVYGGGGNDTLNVYDNAAPLAESYSLYLTGPGAATLLVPSSFFTLWAYDSITTYNLFTGPFKDVIDVVNFSGTLPAMSVNLFGSGGSDTLNLDDDFNVNPATYLVASSGTGAGSIILPSTGFHMGFTTVGLVNLYKSLKPGTVVDKTGYSTAHYVLKIIPDNHMNQSAGEQSAGFPDSINPPPNPAPPAPPLDNEPLARATKYARGHQLPVLPIPDPFAERFFYEAIV